jgi:hypothetical protein
MTTSCRLMCAVAHSLISRTRAATALAYPVLGKPLALHHGLRTLPGAASGQFALHRNMRRRRDIVRLKP